MPGETYPIGLSILDFVPNIAFIIGAYFLVRVVRRHRGKGASRLMLAGAIAVFLGGFLKATWKALYTFGNIDIAIMSEAQFVLLAPGFLAILVTMVLMLRGDKKPGGTTLLPAMAVWKIPLLAVMTICSISTQGILAALAIKNRCHGAAAGFIITAIALLAMAGMAGGAQTVARQWIEEIVNTAGQLSFMAASYLFYRNYVKSASGGKTATSS